MAVAIATRGFSPPRQNCDHTISRTIPVLHINKLLLLGAQEGSGCRRFTCRVTFRLPTTTQLAQCFREAPDACVELCKLVSPGSV